MFIAYIIYNIIIFIGIINLLLYIFDDKNYNFSENSQKHPLSQDTDQSGTLLLLSSSAIITVLWILFLILSGTNSREEMSRLTETNSFWYIIMYVGLIIETSSIFGLILRLIRLVANKFKKTISISLGLILTFFITILSWLLFSPVMNEPGILKHTLFFYTNICF